MLLNDFFTIENIEASDTEVKAELLINPAHKIFEGHFPGQPVVPGVCMMQVLKELLEQVLQKETVLTTAAEMKFLAVIDPSVNNRLSASVRYTTEDGQIKIVGSLFKDSIVHFRMKAAFV
jgi:3-hydroxyacyl-[acyl-carrier-protein] dehydratase